ncbi:MAG: 1-acyl-sn-glycerol-3-phosphate acyltransferase [Bacteroidales bacterium]|nr:1-acyl-sn-glycerol-3-phosphate acyltransferase [Bacteroidales bacterium]
MSAHPQDRFLDLDKIIANKFGAGKVSGFIVRFLKRFIHQDWLNEMLEIEADGADFCEELLKRMDVKIEVEGLENVPVDGTRYTFASNHPLGAADGIALCALITRNFGPMRMLVNDFLLYIQPIAPLCVPINKVGAQARNLPQLIDEAYRSDDHLLMFPAGICSRKVNGRLQDLPWTKTFLTKSIETDRAVVPVHFIGQNPPRFYRADWFFRKFLKVKFNIPMLFLPDAFYHAQHKTFKVILGKPIPAATFDKSRKPMEWVRWIREKVYQL